MILGWVDWLIRLGPSQVDFAVPIRVDNARAPPLGSFGVMGLVPGIDVDPRDPAADPEIDNVILADLIMIRAEARVDMPPLTRFRIVHGQLPVTLFQRIEVAELVRARPAEGRLLLALTIADCHPHASFSVDGYAARIGGTLPDLGTEMRRGCRGCIER